MKFLVGVYKHPGSEDSESTWEMVYAHSKLVFLNSENWLRRKRNTLVFLDEFGQVVKEYAPGVWSGVIEGGDVEKLGHTWGHVEPGAFKKEGG